MPARRSLPLALGVTLAIAALAVGACNRRREGRSVTASPAASAREASSAPAAPPASTPPVASVAAPGPAAGTAAPRVDNVVLITIDALRADQPWTGYTRVRAPYLSALAAKSTVYENAYALSNMTTSSLSAMLAGRYPSELVRSRCPLAGYAARPDALAPILKANGVTSVAALAHLAFVSRLVPDAGFAAWRLVENASASVVQGAVSGDALATLFVRTIAEAAGRGRFFAWAHFIDPHDKYVPHRDFPVTERDARALYDGEVAYTDAMVGRVLQAIDAAPYAQRTAVIVTADHGEAFGEHGARKHGFSTYDAELRVPLLVYVPGVAPRRLAVTRGAIDIAPTIAALLGVAAPAAWRGASLLEDLGDTSPAARPVIVDMPELDGRPAARVVLSDGHKVVTGAAGVRVIDIVNDRGENKPIKDPASVAARVEAARGIARASIAEVPARACGKL